MRHFAYKDGVLHAEDVSLDRIADEVGTPLYCYSTATLERHYRVFSEALAAVPSLICFAVKANSNLSVLSTLAKLGAGADVVSGGELKRALAAGIPAERIVFSGIGKTAPEMRAALEVGIHQFNVESLPELELLSDMASSMDRVAPVALRINPDVDARTHEKISTGKAENKFGIPSHEALQVYGRAANLSGIEVVGVDVHIGSQLTELGPFREAFERAADLVAKLRNEGHTIKTLDLGGGLGIPYEPGEPPPHPDAYGAMVAEVASEVDCELIFEPGRLIAGNAGVLVSKVIYVKEGDERTFVILDAAMNDLIRPALYDAYHGIEPVAEPSPSDPVNPVDFVGPVCESSDTFARDRQSTPLKAGDLVVIHSAGAYGAVQSNSYNTRALIPEVIVNNDEFSIVRERVDIDALIAMDSIAPWLEK